MVDKSLSRSIEFAIRWCRVWGFAIPEICFTPYHNLLLFGGKVMVFSGNAKAFDDYSTSSNSSLSA